MLPRLRTFPRFSPSALIATAAPLLKGQRLLNNSKSCPYAASFSTTAAAWYASGREPTYYEVLNVPVTATTAEIKKFELLFFE
jgi:hypothetical protein